MQTYKIRDKETGMIVSLRGDAPPQESDLPKIFSDAQKRASTLLSSGDYKFDETYNKLPKQQRRDRIRTLSAQAIGAAPEDVDIETGMGVLGRMKLSFQPTKQDQIKHLEDTYGRENVRGIEIGNRIDIFYKDKAETGNKWRMVDEEGKSFADFFADPVGEVIPTAGAVAGGVVGSIVGSPIIGGTAGAAAGYATAASAQDVAVRALSGEPIRPGDIAKRTAVETAIGVPVDLATAGAGKFISKRIGKTATDAFANSLDKAQRRLSRAGYQVERTSGMEIGRRAATEESAIAGKRPDSKIAQKLEGMRDTLDEFSKAARGEGVDTAEAFGKTLDRIRRQADEFKDGVSAQDKQLGEIIGKSLDRKIQRLQVEEIDLEPLGNQIRELFTSGESAAFRQNKDNWTALNQLASERGVSTTAGRVAQKIGGALDRFKVKRNAEVDRILGDMVERGDEAIDFATLRELIEQVQDAVPTGGAVGGKTAQQVASAVAESLRDLRGELAARGGREFAKLYEDTTKYYIDNFLQFKRGAVGRTLKEQLGAPSMTGRQVVRAILNDPAQIRQAVRAARMQPSAESESLIQDLRRAYLNQIGLGRTGVPIESGLKFDREIVRELYSMGSDGIYRPARGQRKVEALDALNRSLKKSKIGDGNVELSDIEELLETLTGNEQKRVIDAITKRAAAKQQQDEALANVLWKRAANGDFSALDNEEFAKAALTKPSQQLRKLIEQMPEESVPGFKQDFARAVFGNAQGGEQLTSRGVSMWNPDKMKVILRKQAGQIKAVLGEEAYKDLVSANDLLDASRVLSGQEAAVALRASGGPQGFHFFLVGSVLNAFRDRFMGWAYGSGQMKPLIKLMQKRVSQEQFEKNFSRIFGSMIGTRKGIEALARESEKDPSFKEAMLDLSAQMSEAE